MIGAEPVAVSRVAAELRAAERDVRERQARVHRGDRAGPARLRRQVPQQLPLDHRRREQEVPPPGLGVRPHMSTCPLECHL